MVEYGVESACLLIQRDEVSACGLKLCVDEV